METDLTISLVAPELPATTTVQSVMTVIPIHETEAASSEEPLPSTVAFSSVEYIAPTGVPSSPEEIDAASTVSLSSAGEVAPTGVPASIEEISTPSTVALSSADEIAPTGVPASIEETSTLSTVAPSSVDEIAPTAVPSSTEEITTTYSSTVTSTYLSTDFVTVTSSYPSASSIASAPPAPPANVPTPVVTVIETPGVYTIPATTMTLTKTEVVCVPETTSLAPGTQTYGGVTTIVATETTVVCPLATVTVEDGVIISKIYTTTYVCPSAGTYTIGATTSTVTGTVTVPCEYPVPTAFPPGTYTQPEAVVTITVTSQVVTCPLFTAGPTAGPSTTAAPVVATSVPVASAPVASAPVASAPVTSATPASSVVATVIPSAPASVSSVVPAPPVQSAPVSSPGDGPWAITYSPYTSNGGCKSASDVNADIADIASKGFNNVRLYATDCSGLENVGRAAESHGLGLILGAFIKAGGVSTADSQVKDIIAWGKWDITVMIVIGNESIFNGFCSASELAAYISTVATQVKAAGYKGPITTTEPLNILQASGSTLCSVIDNIGVNIHPYFNSAVTADMAGEFLASQLQLAEGKPICPHSLT